MHSGAFKHCKSMASALEHNNRENKSCCFSNLKVKIKNPALTFFQAWHILHAHVKFFV